MKYIILTASLILHATLSASNVVPENEQRDHPNMSYMGSIRLPLDMKRKVLDDEELSPQDILCFGFTNKEHYKFISDRYPAKLTLVALRQRIKTIFSNNNSFGDEEEAIEAANLFLEAYFPNSNAIDAFIDIHLPQDIQEPYKAFLEYVSGCFPNNNKRGYFKLRRAVISINGDFANFGDYYNTAFLPPEISNLTNLKYLALNGLQLQNIHDISNLTNLETLNLRDNELRVIPGISALTNLDTLMLEDNQLQSLPEISTRTNLRVLGLSYNRFQFLPNIANLANLEVLNLRSLNELQEEPDISALTSALPNLHFIDSGDFDSSDLEDLYLDDSAEYNSSGLEDFSLNDSQEYDFSDEESDFSENE